MLAFVRFSIWDTDLLDDEITERTQVACNLNEADRCEMFYVKVGTIYMKVTSSNIPESDTQMIFNLFILETNRTCLHPILFHEGERQCVCVCSWALMFNANVCVCVHGTTDEAVPLLWENNELTHSRVYRDNTMRVWWPASGDEDDAYNGTDDVTSVYRYDTPTFEGFHARDHMPPRDYYQTECSVKLWMKKDEAATSAVAVTTSKDGKRIGSTTVANLSKDSASIFAIVVNRGDHLGATYPLFVVNTVVRSSLHFLSVFFVIMTVFFILL